MLVKSLFDEFVNCVYIPSGLKRFNFMIITNHAFLTIGADDLKCEEPVLSALEQLSCT